MFVDDGNCYEVIDGHHSHHITSNVVITSKHQDLDPALNSKSITKIDNFN